MEQRKYYKNNDRSGQGRRPARERAEADTAENLLEGRNAVQEALAAGRTIDKLYIADGDTDRALARLASAAQRDEDYFSMQLDEHAGQPLLLADGACLLREKLVGLHPALTSRAFIRLAEAAGIPAQSAQTIERLSACLTQEGRCAVNLIGGGRAEFGARYVCFLHEMQIEETPITLNGATQTPFGTFTVRQARGGEFGDGVTTQTMDARDLAGAVVAPWRAEDEMTPFGARKAVRMKKLLEGVEHGLRRSVPILRRGNTLLWMPGVRPAEICRGREGGARVLVSFENRFAGGFSENGKYTK